MPGSTRLPRRVVCACLPLLLLLGCATAGDNDANANNQNPAALVSEKDLGVPLAAMHRTYEHEIMLAGRPAPLPDGFWYLAGRGIGTGLGGELDETLLLLRQSGRSVSGFLVYQANPVDRPAQGYPLFASCSDGDRLFGYIHAAAPNGVQDCMSVQTVSNMALRAPNRPVMLKALVNAADIRNLDIPETMVVISFVLANDKHVMVLTLYLNPDLSGVPSESSVVHTQGGWAKDNIDNNPARSAYMRRLKSWTEGWHDVLKTAFDGGGVHVPSDAGATP